MDVHGQGAPGFILFLQTFDDAKASIHFDPWEDVAVLGTIEHGPLDVLRSSNESYFLRKRTPVVGSLNGPITNRTSFQQPSVSISMVDRVANCIKDVHLRVMQG